MRKWMLSVAIVSVLALSACAEDKKQSAKENETAVAKEAIEKEVSLTLPASFFEGLAEDEILENAKERGFKNFKLQDDGSATFSMVKSNHQQMLKDFKAEITKSFEDIISSNEYPSIKKITHNKDFTSFQLTVDREQYDNGFDSMAQFTLIMGSTYYNVLNGISEEDLKIKFEIVDEKTDEVYQSSVYPDDLEDSLN